MAFHKFFNLFIRASVVALFVFCGSSQGDEILNKLNALPGASVSIIENAAGFEQGYHLTLTQPLDHENPAGESFQQQIYIGHIDVNAPVVLGTEGYQVYGLNKYELSAVLGANQIVVEHRFFNKSSPDSMNWQYLNIRQAAADHHRVVTLLKPIYGGKWVNSGISKGGQTALFHRRYYPDDVVATVAYVAPIPLSFTDGRLLEFLDNVGEAECREKIRNLQRMLLSHRDELLPLMKKWAADEEETYAIGIERAFEYAVLEYPFSFWQSGGSSCEKIPVAWSSADEIFAHFKKVVPFGLYSDKGIARYKSFFYQAATELGYYGYATDHLKDLLKVVPEPNNQLFGPQEADLTYKDGVMQDVWEWLTNEGNNIIYIYGEIDAWSGAAVNPAASTNALKMVNPGADHSTRIANFSAEDQEKIFKTLESWLGQKIPGFAGVTNRGSMPVNALFLLAAVLLTLILVRRKMQQN